MKGKLKKPNEKVIKELERMEVVHKRALELGEEYRKTSTKRWGGREKCLT